ncbi:PREDICTED: T-kininogen 2-like [Nanorana parkeri]|uniref:T-kininogen 2-like n=1 Tax=Nanorana parkeri TaxID=125878 RepID=UPI000854740F|nr:PREDICTED: T-kininogen 2-like [Nanorana parkeri]
MNNFYTGSAVPVSVTDVDCDNESIFEAVDEALKSYNGEKVDGNKFILYRITEAKIRVENDNLTDQFVNFEIRESVCPLKAYTSWKQCDFKSEDAERGECSAHILVDTAQNTKKVLSKNCSIIPKVVEPTVSVVVVPCLGCYVPIDPNNEELSTIIQSAIENVNKVANHPFYFELQSVTNAERKVVSGWIYKLEFNITQTNCSKSVYANVNTEVCTTDINGERGHCLTMVFLPPNGEVRDINSQCYLSTGFCLHCPVVVDNGDPEIQTLIRKFIEEYNLKNHTKLYNVVNVTEATRTMEAEKKKFKLKFTIQATNCSKSGHAIPGDECAIEQQSNPLACDVIVDVVKETANILPDYQCFSTRARAVTVKGFSPLRSIVQRDRRALEKSKGIGHGQNVHKGEKQEEKHGKMNEKEKKDHDKKKDHEKQKDRKKKKDHSSEESEEDHRKKPESPPKKPGFDFDRGSERDKVTQHPIVTERVTRKPAMQPPTPFIPKFPPSTNQATLTPDVSTSTLATAIPDYTGTLPTIKTVLDFPVLPPLNAPKCPGKVWQPLLIIPKFATEKPFIIDGLFSAADDLDPPKDQDPSTDLSTTIFF